MKRPQFQAIFSLVVAILFLLPSATVLGSTSGEDDPIIPEAVIDQPSDGMTDSGSEDSAEQEDPLLPDLLPGSDDMTLMPYGKNYATPTRPGTTRPGGFDTSVRAKSSVMVIQKIGLHDEDEIPVERLDDGQQGKISAEISNEGGEWDVMTDVEVDFYYIDRDEDVYYIGSDLLPLIEGEGESATAMVDWTADMLAEKIRVVADPDGSDGGPAIEEQEVEIVQADYAQKLYCSYPAGSGTAGDTLNYWIKVNNIGKKNDNIKLETQGAGVWTVQFDNGQSSKTIFNLGSDQYTWEEVSVTIPAGAGGNDRRDISIVATSQSDTDKSRSLVITTTVLRSSRPILVFDRDRGSSEYGTWCDTSKYWTTALNDGGYEGMFFYTASLPSDLSSYDVILMNTGYDWQYGLQSSEQTSLINYLKNGGSLWIGGAMFMQGSNEPAWGKTTTNPLFWRYMNASWQAQSRNPPRPVIGVAGDPIGKGRIYGTNTIFTEGQDWAEAIWPYANDTWSDGVFYMGNEYLGVRHHWQGSTVDKPNQYRTLFTGVDLAQVGDTYEKDENGYYGHPDRTDLMFNAVTWLGVSPPLPHANDLGVTEIIDPQGQYIYPGDQMEINIEVANFGIKDFESTFTMTVDIEAVQGGSYSTTLTQNVDTRNNPIPARGWAYPGTTVVSLTWTVPNDEDVRYRFTASVSDDDDNDNNEMVTEATSKKIEDVKAVGSVWEWRLHYWLAAVKNTPVRIDVEVENVGARTMTFTTYVDIVDPWESGILEGFEREITLGAGHVRKVPFVWTPDKAAGCRDATQSWRVNYASDGPPYWLNVGVHIEDDEPGNDHVRYAKGSYGSNVGDVTVVDWYESGERGSSGWDGFGPEHVWHWSPLGAFGGEFGIWHGNKSSVETGVPRYDHDTKGIMTSPVLDWTQYSAIRSDYLYTSQMQSPDYVSLQIKMHDSPDYWKDAPRNYYANYSHNSGSGGYLNNGNNYVDYANHETQLRWCFWSDASNNNQGFNFDVFMIMATASNYFDRDLTMDTIVVDPLIGQAEEERTIRVTIKNIGEVIPDGEIKIWMNLTDDQGNLQTQSISPRSHSQNLEYDAEFKKHTTKTFEWQWFPEVLGIYNIECSVEWEADEFPENNHMEAVGLVQFYFFFDNMEDGNPPPKPQSQGGGFYSPWITGTEDSDGRRGDLATDEWELGMPQVGPGDAWSGDSCWGTSLTTYYGNHSKDSSYLMRNIDLRTAKDPYLIFAHWLEIEAQGYDTAYVEIQEVGSDTWTVLWKNPEPERQVFRTNGWQMVDISLEAWQLKDLNLRFRLQSDSDVSFPGWYIDDVGISGIDPPQRDAGIERIEIDPFYGGNIPPGESILIGAWVRNIGTRDSGGSNRITVSGKVYRVTGTTENKLADLQGQEVQINSGDTDVVWFNYQLPAGNGIQYRIEVEVDYPGEDEKDRVDNVMDIRVWGRKLYDASIDRLHATPVLEDAGYPRVVTAVVTSHCNVPAGYGAAGEPTFNIDFTARFKGESQIIAQGKVPVRLQVGETASVEWNWTSYHYGIYEVTAKVELEDVDNHRTIEVRTVEKEFSDGVDGPVLVGEEEIENHVFWSGFAQSPSASGWHQMNVGYLSRWSYYCGRPESWSYTGNRNDELISGPIDLRQVEGATLRWYTMFHLEGGAYDNLIVYFSDDNGESWNQQYIYPRSEPRNSTQYAGHDGGWIMKEIPLENRYFTEDFRIKYRFVSDRAINFMGVFLDDISIYVTSTGKNHAPVARFTAEWLGEDGQVRDKGTAFSNRLITRPVHEFMEIRGNPLYNNLPNPEGGRQGGIGFDSEDGLSDVIRFNAGYSYDPDRFDSEPTYTWKLGDGQTRHGKTLEYQYDEIPLEKFFEVTLEVKDEHGAFTTDTLKVWLGNSPPVVKFDITPSFDTSDILNDEFGAEVFYGDTILLISDVTDPEGDRIVMYEWSFGVKGQIPHTFATGETIDFRVGFQHLWRDKEGNTPVMPAYNTNPVVYTITLTAADDKGNEASFSLDVTVHPYANAEFVTPVRLGATLLDATVDLVWRGFVDEAAPGIAYVSPEKPVFVRIEPTTSPDPTLANRGGVGLVYNIRAQGVHLQNGNEGFISAEISIPILTSDLEAIGDAFSLQDDLRLQRYDETQKRFFVVEGSRVISDGGVKFVVGEVDHFSLFTAIVDSIYNPANPNYENVLPDLSVFEIKFSRSPAQNGQEVEIRATIRNTGKINAKNVEVKFFDGDDLVGDLRIDSIPASGGTVVVTGTFIVTMLNPELISERHEIEVHVNKMRAIKESNYRNNVGSEILDVTQMQSTTPSFESTSMMLVVSAAAVVGASMAVVTKGIRRKEEE